MHRSACGAPLKGKKRDELLASLEAAAKRAEADAAPRAKVGCMATLARLSPLWLAQARKQSSWSLRAAQMCPSGLRIGRVCLCI